MKKMRLPSSGRSIKTDGRWATPTREDPNYASRSRMRMASSGRQLNNRPRSRMRMASSGRRAAAPPIIATDRAEEGRPSNASLPTSTGLWKKAQSFIEANTLKLNIEGMDDDELRGMTPELGVAMGWSVEDSEALVGFIASAVSNDENET